MTSQEQHASHLAIFCTDKVWEFDMAREALKESNIPFYGQTEGSGALATAMSTPSTQAPGVFWSILVPRDFWDRALEVLTECRLDALPKPIEIETPDPEATSLWAFYGRFILILAIVLFAVWAVLTYR